MKELSSAGKALWAKKGRHREMSWLPLHQHMADAAGVARLLWQEWLSPGERHRIASGLNNPSLAQSFFVFLAAAHDLGKATPLFQAQPRGFPPDDLDQEQMENLKAQGLPCEPYSFFINSRATPHALASQVLLLQAGCAPAIAAILGAHHGKPSESIALSERPYQAFAQHYYLCTAGKVPWSTVQTDLLLYALCLSGFEGLGDLPQPDFPSQVLLCGLVIMADWIASNEALFPYQGWGEADLRVQGQERLEDAWQRLQLPLPWVFDDLALTPDYYLDRFGIRSPYLSQSMALEIVQNTAFPGIFILEAPMGTGKTEAALVAAEIFAEKAGKSGVFFALPTQATSNAIFSRLLAWTKALDLQGSHAIRLAHGKAQFHDEYKDLPKGGRDTWQRYEGEILVHQWFEGSKKSLLADFVVGTIDQFLLAALRQRHVMLRHLGLFGKVVILDECHAYDAYMNQYLDRALRWMGIYHVPVIILSATLPAARRAQLVQAYLGGDGLTMSKAQRRNRERIPAPAWTKSRGYPLVTWTDGQQVHQHEIPLFGSSLEVALEPLAREDLTARLKALLVNGGYAGVIVNTVSRAQAIYQELAETFGAAQVTLAHARFIAPDRIRTETRLLGMLGKSMGSQPRSGTHIVVGTQVIEQSLDLDFDVLVSDLCPMDLLLQRMGRLHRHERSRPLELTAPRCLILGLQEEGFEPGALAIYKAYPLLRTKALLPEHSLRLPEDIPRLVQDVYDLDVCLPNEPPGYEQAQSEWLKLLEKQRSQAGAYLLKSPFLEDILNDWLINTPLEAAGEASVRDSAESLEVLVVVKNQDGLLSPLPWVDFPAGKRRLDPLLVPGEEAARYLARQSLRLPYALCHAGIIHRSIEELEASNQPIAAWQDSPWLKGQLFLLLDAELRVSLCGIDLLYDKNRGLLIENEGGDHAGKGV